MKGIVYFTVTVVVAKGFVPVGGQEGATVRSGAKVMQAKGRIKAYAFASTTDEMIEWLRTKGPITVGTNWTDSMFNPDSQGRVVPSGEAVGGHCYLCVGVNGNELVFRNSWGADWGRGGNFRMFIEDFSRLLDDGGEAITAVELPI